MQEAEHGVKDISAGKEAAEDLRVVAVQPFAAKLYGVLSGEHRKGIANLDALERFINARLEEERLAETERGAEPHSGIGRNLGVHRGTGTILAGETYVRFIHTPGRNRAEKIEVDGIDLGRTFNAVGGIAICRNIKGLVLIVGPIKIIGRAHVVPGVERPIKFAQQSGVADRMLYRQSFGLTPAGLEKVEQCQALAVGIASQQSGVCGQSG